MFGGGDKIEARPLYLEREKLAARVGKTWGIISLC